MKRIGMPVSATENQINAAYTILTAEGLAVDAAKSLCREIYDAFVQTSPKPNSGGLTPRQLEYMIALQAFIDTAGYAPSLSELGNEVGEPYKSNVKRMLNVLDRRGFIMRGDSGGHREITLLKRVY